MHSFSQLKKAINRAKVCAERGNSGIWNPRRSLINCCKICQGLRYIVKDVSPRLTSNNLASLSPSSLVEGMMVAGLVLGPCPATLFGICRPVNEINYKPTHSYLTEYDAP